MRRDLTQNAQTKSTIWWSSLWTFA